MSQENDHDFRDQHTILVLEMLTNPCGGLVTKILLHSVIDDFIAIFLYCLLKQRICSIASNVKMWNYYKSLFLS